MEGWLAEQSLENISRNPKWRKYYLDDAFTTAIQKNIALLCKMKSSETVKQAMDDLKRIFLEKQALLDAKCVKPDSEKDRTLINIFAIATKYYFSNVLKEKEVIEKVYLLRELIDIGNAVSKGIQFRVSALWKLNQHTPYNSLFETFSEDVDFLRTISSLLAKRERKASHPDDETTLDVLLSKLPLVDDATQACLVLAVHGVANGHYFRQGQIEQFEQILGEFLIKPDISLSKLMAAVILAKSTRRKDKPERAISVIKVLADYVKWCSEYETLVKEVFIHEQIKLRSEVATSLVDMEGLLDDDSAIFVELALTNLKERTNANMTHYAVEMVLLFVLKAPLIPGTKIIDLPNQAQEFCKTLSEIDHIWKNPQVCDIFTKYSVPNTMEKMHQFIEDTEDDGDVRFPAFDTLDQVPWNELSHAYGTAERVPTSLRKLASWVPRIRKEALSGLEISVTHQGQCYSSTPYVVPFFLELVDAKLVQDKDKLLEFCASMLADRAGSFLTSFDGLDLEDVWQHFPDILAIRLDIEKKLTNDLPKIIGFLSNERSEVRGWAAYLLLLLPKAAKESVPTLQERYAVETDPKVKATIMVALSVLWVKYSDELDPFIKFAQEQYEEFKNSENLELEFAAIASFIRFSDDDLPALQRFSKMLLMEDDEISEKRENFAIQVPKVFILELLQTYIDAADLIPVVAEYMLLPSYYIRVIATETAFALVFRTYNRPPLHGGHFSPEQKLVLENALEFFRQTHHHYLELEIGLPHNLERCEELLEEAQVFGDLYGEFM